MSPSCLSIHATTWDHPNIVVWWMARKMVVPIVLRQSSPASPAESRDATRDASTFPGSTQRPNFKPMPELHPTGSEAVWKFLFVFLITAKAQSPVVHTGTTDAPCTRLHRDKTRQTPTRFARLSSLISCSSLFLPSAICNNDNEICKAPGKHIVSNIGTSHCGIVAVTPGKGEEADGRSTVAPALFEGCRRTGLLIL